MEEERARPRIPMEQRRAEQAAEELFAPVRQAAVELSDALKEFPEIEFAINPDSICVDLFDKQFWFSYDPSRHCFVGDEFGYSWLESELREEQYQWKDAQECIDAMIRVCARYATLAQAIRSLQPKAEVEMSPPSTGSRPKTGSS